ADLFGNFDLLLGDERPRDRGAEQILALVERVRPEHWEDIVAHELLAQVLDEDVLRLDAEQQRLVARRRKLLALAEIGREGDDLAAIGGLQPFEDGRGIEPARIGEHDFLDVFGHALSLLGRPPRAAKIARTIGGMPCGASAVAARYCVAVGTSLMLS